MSFLICARKKAKKRRVDEKKGCQLPNVEITPADIESPENSVLIPDTPLPSPVDEFVPVKASVTFAPGTVVNNGGINADKHSPDIMACQEEIILKLQRENESLKKQLQASKGQGEDELKEEVRKLRTEVESLRAQNAALVKGIRDTGISAKVMEDREEKLRSEEQKLVAERQTVQSQIQDCYAKMKPILAREACRQEEVNDLREKVARQNRSSRRIFELMERLMIEWKQNVLLRAEVKKLKTLILSSSRSLNNITRTMDDSEYKVRGAIKTEVSKVVKVTYDSKREVIQYQQVINDALDCMLAIRQLQTTDSCTKAGEYQLALQKLKDDHKDVSAVIGLSWRKVGRNLGFTVAELQSLSESGGYATPDQIAWRLLERWTENTEDESLLLGNFITALREAEIDTSIGPMPEDDAAVLQRLNTYLHQSIKQISGVLPFMYGFGLLTSTMKRFIERGEPDSEKVRRLLSIVPTLGEHTLPIFSEILRLGGHDNVAEQICKEQLQVRLERSDNIEKTPTFLGGHLPDDFRLHADDTNGNEANTVT